MDENYFGGEGIWLFALLILVFLSNGGLFGGNRADGRCATTDDLQNVSNFQALERQMNEGVAATRQGVYDVTGAIKDTSYNNLAEIRDLQAIVAQGNAQSQQCCCEILRGIDGINYNGAINTASINANTTASMQKILDMMYQNKIESQAQRINQLEINQALCGVVRYPMSTAYCSGANPFCGCGCPCGNV